MGYTTRTRTMNYLIVLDYTLNIVNVYPYDYPEGKECEEILDDLGHNPGDCSWMITDKLDLHISI